MSEGVAGRELADQIVLYVKKGKVLPRSVLYLLLIPTCSARFPL